MRSTLQFSAAAVMCALALASPCAAQSAFGLGPRMSMVRSDVNSEADAVKFLGGQIRSRLSPKTGLEISMDVHTERDDTLTQRVRDIPIQASLLLYPTRSTFSPYLLGGAGWYSHRVETLAGEEVLTSETTRKFGWHAGFGAEIRLGKHAGVHADYRYTFLHFGSDDNKVDSNTIGGAIASAQDSSSSSGSRFLPKYDGSMWTAGFTVYF